MFKIYILSILLFSACGNISKSNDVALSQDQLFKRDGIEILQEIEDMSKADQNIRNYSEYGTIDSLMIDSLESLIKNSGLPTGLDVITEDNKIILSKQEQDSVIKIISLLQTKHTKRMVEIISKYGYPTSERFGDTSRNVNPALILHHPDMSFKDTIMNLLQKELALGRIDTNTFEMTKWDYNGREGIPNIKGVTIIKQDPITGKYDTLQ